MSSLLSALMIVVNTENNDVFVVLYVLFACTVRMNCLNSKLQPFFPLRMLKVPEKCNMSSHEKVKMLVTSKLAT